MVEEFSRYLFSLPDGQFIPVLLLLVGVMYLMTTCHEGGHYYIAALCGVNCREFKLGVGPALRFPLKGGTYLSLGLFPLGGSVTYDGTSYWASSHTQRAMMSAGGWFADLAILGLLYWTLQALPTGAAFSRAVFALATFRVIVGLTPLTGDGRSVVRHVWYALKAVGP